MHEKINRLMRRADALFEPDAVPRYSVLLKSGETVDYYGAEILIPALSGEIVGITICEAGNKTHPVDTARLAQLLSDTPVTIEGE